MNQTRTDDGFIIVLVVSTMTVIAVMLILLAQVALVQTRLTAHYFKWLSDSHTGVKVTTNYQHKHSSINKLDAK